MSNPAWLHVYPAKLWHDPVCILGTEDALRRLAAKLIEAADQGESVARCVVNDGEGYVVEIARVDNIVERQDIPVHYVDNIAADLDQIPADVCDRIRAVYDRGYVP